MTPLALVIFIAPHVLKELAIIAPFGGLLPRLHRPVGVALLGPVGHNLWCRGHVQRCAWQCYTSTSFCTGASNASNNTASMPTKSAGHKCTSSPPERREKTGLVLAAGWHWRSSCHSLERAKFIWWHRLRAIRACWGGKAEF